MKTHPVTIDIPEPFIDRFINTYEKAFETTLSAQEIEVKLQEFIKEVFMLKVTKWAVEHGTL